MAMQYPVKHSDELGVPSWEEEIKIRIANTDFTGCGYKLEKWPSTTKT
jgi:hypothetical protein